MLGSFAEDTRAYRRLAGLYRANMAQRNRDCNHKQACWFRKPKNKWVTNISWFYKRWMSWVLFSPFFSSP